MVISHFLRTYIYWNAYFQPISTRETARNEENYAAQESVKCVCIWIFALWCCTFDKRNVQKKIFGDALFSHTVWWSLIKHCARCVQTLEGNERSPETALQRPSYKKFWLSRQLFEKQNLGSEMEFAYLQLFQNGKSRLYFCTKIFRIFKKRFFFVFCFFLLLSLFRWRILSIRLNRHFELSLVSRPGDWCVAKVCGCMFCETHVRLRQFFGLCIITIPDRVEEIRRDPTITRLTHWAVTRLCLQGSR